MNGVRKHPFIRFSPKSIKTFFVFFRLLLSSCGNSLTTLAAEVFIIFCNDRNVLTWIQNKMYFFSINSFCYLFIFSEFIRSVVVGSRIEYGISEKVRIFWLSFIYGNRRCKFRFPHQSPFLFDVQISLVENPKFFVIQKPIW